MSSSNNLEIERKYLTHFKNEKEVQEICDITTSRRIHSIYIKNTVDKTIRVVKDTWHLGKIEYRMTYKEKTSDPRIRIEEEFLIEEKVFEIFNRGFFAQISKTRYLKPIDETLIWEIDVFDDYPFIIAELEMDDSLKDFDFSKNESWIIKEVTNDPFYLNCNLAK